MHKIFLSILIGFICTPLASCDNSTGSVQKLDHNITLNNGERWEANTATTEGVQNMIAMMQSFNELDNIEAFTQLSTNLKSEFSLIFKNCTMTGEAHNQLHNFLIPIKDSFAVLSSSDLPKCQEGYYSLLSHLQEYPVYFK